MRGLVSIGGGAVTMAYTDIAATTPHAKQTMMFHTMPTQMGTRDSLLA